MGRLIPTAEDKREVRGALLPLLARDGDTGEGPVGIASRLMAGLEHLEPTVSDLNNWTKWVIDPSDQLLTVIRRNSTLQEWLGGLHALEALS